MVLAFLGVGNSANAKRKEGGDMNGRTKCGIVAALGMVMVTGMASALPVHMTVGDKIFENFGVTVVDPDSVSVVGVGSGVPGDWYGIQINGPFISPIGGQIDVAFTYTVRTASGLELIKDIEQGFNFTAAGNGGSVFIGETVFDAGFGSGNNVAQSSVSKSGLGNDLSDPPGELVQGDLLDFSATPKAKLWITKDIRVVGNAGGLAGATIIWQRFSQTSVPDGGATAMLLGLALTGVAALRRLFA